MNYEVFINDLWMKVRSCPRDWRTGQAVFNVLEETYGDVTRKVQFEDGVDCFYNDDNIVDFIALVWKRLTMN